MIKYTTALAAIALSVGCAANEPTAPLSADQVVTGDEGAPAPQEAQSDIVDTAVAAGSFKTLVAAVEAADLVATLKGDGPFTVFAPTDEAFAKLPAGTVEDLLKPENKAKLQALLKYHVVAGKVDAAQVMSMTEAETVQGGKLTIRAGDGGVKVDEANVIKADIECSNGIIHVIDAVVLPE
jgi:uncharacterized surface protein with fasciclin (FAS1) repeats